jgi:hypothetical protein
MGVSYTQFESEPIGTTDTLLGSGGGIANTSGSGTIDLSVGETAVVTFDVKERGLDDDPSFVTANTVPVGTFEVTNADTGLFSYTISQTDWVAAGSPSVIRLEFDSDLPNAEEAFFILTITCFAPGTLIETSVGETTVETLKIGDMIRTADGRDVAVKWVGVQTVSTVFSENVERLQPVLISKGALGHGQPHTDLTVTADHGMVIDGLVINAGALVNGTTIRVLPMAEMGETFTVYHIETEAHDVILANGAPAETFIDYAGRQSFDNYAEYVDLYGAERIIPDLPMSRISSCRQLPAALRDRFGIAGVGDEITDEVFACQADRGAA